MDVDWIAVYAVFSGLTFVVLAVAGLYGGFQLREMARARTLHALNQIHIELHSKEAKLDRGVLYNIGLDGMPPSEFKNLSDSDRAAVERVADSWQHVGIVAQYRLIRRDILFDYFAGALLLSYKNLRKYIEETQTQRGPVYGRHVVWLAGECETYFKRTYGELEFRRVFGVRTLVDD